MTLHLLGDCIINYIKTYFKNLTLKVQYINMLRTTKQYTLVCVERYIIQFFAKELKIYFISI